MFHKCFKIYRMAVETMEVLALLKELITKVCAIDCFDVDAVASCMKHSKKSFGEQQVFKRACNNLLHVLQIIVNDTELDTNDVLTNQAADIGISTVASNKNQCVSVNEQCHSDAVMSNKTSDGHYGADKINESCEPTSSESDQKTPVVDPQFVFLARNKLEIDERIAKYIETKQNDNNMMNIHEFCGLPGGSDVTESCARTAAVFQPRSGHSHLIVQKVVNRCGPQVKIKPSRRQTHLPELETQLHIKSEPMKPSPSESVLPPGVEERLTNMEVHVKLYNGKPVPRDVYERLQQLENRITYLESVSPEYSGSISSVENESKKRRKIEKDDVSSDDIHMYKNLSPTEVDRKIIQLKQRLSRRARELQTLGLQTK